VNSNTLRQCYIPFFYLLLRQECYGIAQHTQPTRLWNHEANRFVLCLLLRTAELQETAREKGRENEKRVGWNYKVPPSTAGCWLSRRRNGMSDKSVSDFG